MVIWQRLCTEFQQLLCSHGAFRDVRMWRIDSSDSDLKLSSGSGTMRAAATRPVPSPRGSRRQLLLVVTDGVGRGWSDGRMQALVRAWTGAGSSAVLNVLPFRLWHRGHIATQPVWWTPPHGRSALPARPRRTLPSPTSDATLRRPVPVLAIAPDWLDPWARLLTGHHQRRVAGAAMVDTVPRTAARRTAAAGTTFARVMRFRASASATAVALAGYLSAAPLTIPLMRLVQRTLLPGSGVEHLAEVFLSGLVVRTAEAVPGEEPDSVVYDFGPDIRPLLRNTVTRRDVYDVMKLMGSAPVGLAAPFGGTLDYRMLIPDPGGRADLPAEGLPFTDVAVANLRSLGGEYARAADRIALGEPVITYRPAPETKGSEQTAQPSTDAVGLAAWLRRWFTPKETPAVPSVTARFGGACPMCRSVLGVAPPVDPATGRYTVAPSIRLETGAAAPDGQRPWRVSAAAGNLLPNVSADPSFSEREVEDVYLFCGEGHLFLESALHARIDRWNLVGMLGAAGTGVATLLTQMMTQRLDDSVVLPNGDHEPLRILFGSPRQGAPPATSGTAIRELIGTITVDGEARARSWGSHRPQPPALVTTEDRIRSWIGFTELSSGTLDRALRTGPTAYETVVWTVEAETPRSSSGGSLPSEYAELARQSRRHATVELGERLAMAGSHGRLQALVAVNRSDRVRDLLAYHRLADLGDPETAKRGAAAYLITARFRHRQGHTVDAATARLLRYLDVGRSTLQHRALEAAGALLAHYSTEQAFWNLAHGGDRDQLVIAGSGDGTGLTLTVPSIADHLDYAVRAAGASRLLFRDTVMSAVACSVVYGSGYGQVMSTLLREHRTLPGLFLCAGGTDTGRSAGLKQLFLHTPKGPRQTAEAAPSLHPGLAAKR